MSSSMSSKPDAARGAVVVVEFQDDLGEVVAGGSDLGGSGWRVAHVLGLCGLNRMQVLDHGVADGGQVTHAIQLGVLHRRYG